MDFTQYWLVKQHFFELNSFFYLSYVIFTTILNNLYRNFWLNLCYFCFYSLILHQTWLKNRKKDSDLYRKTRTAGISGISKNIQLNGNSYNGLSIGLSDLVDEDWSLVVRLIHLIESFSFYLFEETGNRWETIHNGIWRFNVLDFILVMLI